MELEYLPSTASPEMYETQARHLFNAWRSAVPGALSLFRSRHPRFLDAKITWLPRDIPDTEIEAAGLDEHDARLALSRWYDFRDWEALLAHAAEASEPGSPTNCFERAVDVVGNGNQPLLQDLLARAETLVAARSTRITHFDPPVHRATLLHYIAANGVEGHRQKTPANAVEIAETLLAAGAAPDALAGFYGGECATLSLLVSSRHPAHAGLQVPLIHKLVDHGAAVDPLGAGNWRSPLMTALAFGYASAAEALVSRGAKVDNLAAAAGLGRYAEAASLLQSADAETRHRALSLAAQLGHANVVDLLLNAGEDPDRYNLPGLHAHSTPLHQAALAGHEEVVKRLVTRGARLDIRDTIYNGTPLGWARHAGHAHLEPWLSAGE